MKEKKIILTVDFVLLAAMLVLDGCYMFLGGTPIKAVASALFTVIGSANAVYAYRAGIKHKFVFIMPIALAVAAAGDIIINYSFVAGAAVFALGHVLYVAAYYTLDGFSRNDIIFAAAIFVPSVLVITLVPAFDFGGALMEILCVVYALVLSAMVGKAIGFCLSKRTIVAITIAAGSAWFFVSDLALLINTFTSLGREGRLATRILCLATYYPAQFLLAFSVFLFARRMLELVDPEKEGNGTSCVDILIGNN